MDYGVRFRFQFTGFLSIEGFAELKREDQQRQTLSPSIDSPLIFGAVEVSDYHLTTIHLVAQIILNEVLGVQTRWKEDDRKHHYIRLAGFQVPFDGAMNKFDGSLDSFHRIDPNQPNNPPMTMVAIFQSDPGAHLHLEAEGFTYDGVVTKRLRSRLFGGLFVNSHAWNQAEKDDVDLSSLMTLKNLSLVSKYFSTMDDFADAGLDYDPKTSCSRSGSDGTTSSGMCSINVTCHNGGWWSHEDCCCCATKCLPVIQSVTSLSGTGVENSANSLKFCELAAWGIPLCRIRLADTHWEVVAHERGMRFLIFTSKPNHPLAVPSSDQLHVVNTLTDTKDTRGSAPSADPPSNFLVFQGFLGFSWSGRARAALGTHFRAPGSIFHARESKFHAQNRCFVPGDRFLIPEDDFS